MDRFIQEIFRFERKIVPWYSHSVAILACWRSLVAAAATLSGPASGDDNTCKTAHDKLKTSLIRVARQIILPPLTAAQVQVTRTTSGLLLL